MSFESTGAGRALLLAAAICSFCGCGGGGESGASEVAEGATGAGPSAVGPRPAPADVFHPDRGKPYEPAYGGRAIIHLSAMPENLCYPVENSAYTRRLLYEVHETLVLQDWESWEYVPVLCERWDTEDMVVLKAAAAERYGEQAQTVRVKVPAAPDEEPAEASKQRAARVVYGVVSEEADAWLVTPVSRGQRLSQPLRVPKEDVERVEQGTVFTFYLRDDVVWHPADGVEGHKLDARDVLFSWGIYSNPAVDCDEKRFQFEKITQGELIDDLTVRFFYESQYYLAIDSIGTSMTILPAHVYDLSDPDNPAYKPEATPAEQARHINENPHNQMWVGLGPYRVTEYSQQWIQAERFDGYFDEENAGYLDTIRWRYIPDDSTAYQALLNGELDFFERVKSVDYFGAATEKPEFTSKFYKGYFYLGTYGYTGWNLYRPQLEEQSVRHAIAMAFDMLEYRRTNYKDLCNQVTGPFPYNSLAYDHGVAPIPYDPDAAIEMLEDAGWYDRNGDGVRDKDGVELVIEFLMPSGNDASKNFGLKLQESLGEIGIKLEIAQLEWATFLERIKTREFDSCNLAWVPSLESDPEQLWHSKWGRFEVRGSNNAGVMDPYLDELIEQGQRELDKGRRQEIWHKMHRRIYDLQPYLFMYNVPHKFAMSKRIRGFQNVAIDPGYIVRRWHFAAGEPGTRPTVER